MKKLSEFQFYAAIIAVLIVLSLLFSLTWQKEFPGDTPLVVGVDFGGLHFMFNLFSIIILLVAWVWTFIDFLDSDNLDFYNVYENNLEHYKDKHNDSVKKTISSKLIITWCILIFLTFGLYRSGRNMFLDCKTIYNTQKVYDNSYEQKLQERELFYDKMWKTYLEKKNIAAMNKETFVEVTRLIMENRADGKNLLMKWNQENQSIPYNNFSTFYSDLSQFVVSQRDEYFKIEKQCQIISNSSKVMLDTFPNNIYNKILKLEPIKYGYGFTSEKTQKVFKTKNEPVIE